jgi:hypothetical protein
MNYIPNEETNMPMTLDIPDPMEEPSTETNVYPETFDDIDNHDPQDSVVNEKDMSLINQPVSTRSVRRVYKPKHLDDYIVYETRITEFDDTTTSFIDALDPLALMTNGNQDNFYYHEILREPD